MKPSRNVEFWSSVQCGDFLSALVHELSEGGMPAKERFLVSSNDYRSSRRAVSRSKMRWRCYAEYPLALLKRIRCEPPPLALVVCTNTFYAPAVAIHAASSRNIPVVHWVFDLFPDALLLAGAIRERGVSHALLRSVVRRTLMGSAANVFLGDQLHSYAHEKFGVIPNSHVIPVGCDASPFREFKRKGKAHPSVLYCGNMGRLHEWKTIIEAVGLGLPQELEIAFRGGGAGLNKLGAALREAGGANNITIGGELSATEWVATMRAADVALVTIRRGAENVVMPSKTYSALVAGQAILAVCEPNSDLAKLVRRHDCGWVVAPGDARALVKTLGAIVDAPAQLQEKRVRSFEAGHRFYSARALAPCWRQLLDCFREVPPCASSTCSATSQS